MVKSHVCCSSEDLNLYLAHMFGGSQLPVIQAPRDLTPSCGLHGTCTHVHTPTHRPHTHTHVHLCTRTHMHTCTHPSVLPRGRLSSDIWCVWFYLLITYANLLRSGPNFLIQFCTSIFHESPQSRESVGACILMGFWRYCQGPYVHEN